MEKNTGVTFDDAAGVDKAKLKLEEIVPFLKDRNKLWVPRRERSQRHPVGRAPGTGKPLMARAVAGEAGVPFFSTSMSELVMPPKVHSRTRL